MVSICFLAALGLPAQAVAEADADYEICLTLTFADAGEVAHGEEDYQENVFLIQDSNSWYLLAEFDQDTRAYRVTGRTNSKDNATRFHCSKQSNDGGQLLVTGLDAGSFLLTMEQTMEGYSLPKDHNVIIELSDNSAIVDGYILKSYDGSRASLTFVVANQFALPLSGFCWVCWSTRTFGFNIFNVFYLIPALVILLCGIVIVTQLNGIRRNREQPDP